MPNERLWNFLTGETTANVLITVALITAALLVLAILANASSEAYQKWSKQRCLLHDQLLAAAEHNDINKTEQIRQKLRQQKLVNTPVPQWISVVLGIIAVTALISSSAAGVASGHFSKNFAIDSYNPKYAIKRTEPIKSYVFTKDNNDLNDTQSQVYNIANADQITVTTARRQTYRIDSDADTRFTQINVKTKPTKKMPRRYSMTLTTITPKKQYRHYNGARTAKILDVTQYAKLQRTNN